ncbi:protein-glutamine gamma-glutamyltransferase 5 [Pogona vitticeps]
MGDQRLVVRRGQVFAITLHFNARGYQPGQDSIYLIAETGYWPEPQAVTRAVFQVEPGRLDPGHTWRAVPTRNTSQSKEVAVLAPARAPVGHYQLKMRLDSDGASSSYLLGDFVLLFNPWCPEDDVYLEGEAEREEYVLNEHGVIYQGNKNWISPMAWNYGQFEDGILDICLKVLDRSLNFQQDPAKDSSLRGSPVYISRVMSAMINSNDDSGVLLGNWGEDYAGGVRPTEWSGSVAILRQWERTGGRPVKYGQCWVFAAVLCTVMRCLGIPTRVVTNFDSAHEKDGNLVVDVYYDGTGRLVPAGRKDSIWNFHVWDECWMARRDLPLGCGGWQVVDATPQERSRGLYCCGPASVRAIREGDVNLPYDTAFAFSMVNADRVVWLLSGFGKEKLEWDTGAVGARISTKAVGSDRREDITSAYKAPEGSPEERRVFQKAVSLKQPQGTWRTPRAGGLPAAPGPVVPPVAAQLSLQIQLAESPEVGEDIQLTLLARNRASAYREVQLRLSAQAVLHDGRPLAPFWREALDVSFAPGQEKRLRWRIPYRQYGRELGEDKQLRVVAVGEEKSSGQKTLAEKTVTLASPPLEIHVLAPVVLNQALPLQIEFANPLPEPVSGCLLVVEGGGLVRDQVQIPLGSLAARAEAVVRLHLTPYRSGARHLHVSLQSSHFPPVKGCKELRVSPGGGGGGWKCRLP